GDIYIGFEDAWAESGFTPRRFPAAQDTTNTQVRSWIAAMGSGAAPDYNNLGNNDSIGVIDQFGLPGNWMIRATANTADRFCPTATPIPSGVINGHLVCESIPQPDARNVGITATLILTSGGVTRYSALVATDS